MKTKGTVVAGDSFCVFIEMIVQFRTGFGGILVLGRVSGILLLFLGALAGIWGVECRLLMDVGPLVGVAVRDVWLHYDIKC